MHNVGLHRSRSVSTAGEWRLKRRTSFLTINGRHLGYIAEGEGPTIYLQSWENGTCCIQTYNYAPLHCGQMGAIIFLMFIHFYFISCDHQVHNSRARATLYLVHSVLRVSVLMEISKNRHREIHQCVHPECNIERSCKLPWK